MYREELYVSVWLAFSKLVNKNFFKELFRHAVVKTMLVG